MLMRSNRARATFWAMLLVAIGFFAFVSPAHADTCNVPYTSAHMTFAYQPTWSEVNAASRGGMPTTTVLVRLDAGGTVLDDSLWRSSGNADFDAQAVRAVQLSTFAPETRNCVAVSGSYLVNVTGTPQSHLAYSSFTPTPYQMFAPIIVRAQCSSVDGPARITYAYQPEWPEVALAQSVPPATTTVIVTIDDNGNLVDESVWRTSGNQLLDNEALKAVRLSSYAPEIRQCAKVSGSYLMDIAFE
jgi:TonB family protein